MLGFSARGRHRVGGSVSAGGLVVERRSGVVRPGGGSLVEWSARGLLLVGLRRRLLLCGVVCAPVRDGGPLVVPTGTGRGPLLVDVDEAGRRFVTVTGVDIGPAADFEATANRLMRLRRGYARRVYAQTR